MRPASFGAPLPRSPNAGFFQPSLQKKLLAMLLGQPTRHDGAGVLDERRDCRKHTPNPRSAIFGGGQHAHPGRVKQRTQDLALMAAQHGELGASSGVPQPRYVVAESGQHRPPDGSKTALTTAPYGRVGRRVRRRSRHPTAEPSCRERRSARAPPMDRTQPSGSQSHGHAARPARCRLRHPTAAPNGSFKDFPAPNIRDLKKLDRCCPK
jgi:hypothetical protein